MTRVLIIGGGFGGLAAARALKHVDVEITLVDRHNHHVFQPLLYQVATAGLSPGDIASPIRWILRRQQNARVLLATVLRVDPVARRVRLDDGSELGFDFAILATGATHSYFGQEAWSHAAPGLKTLDDAIDIRRRVLLAFERAEREPDPATKRHLLTFVIVGGGPTGVELAGVLTEIARYTLSREYDTIDPGSARVVLVEGGPTILSSFPERLREVARRDLRGLGVEVIENAQVTGIDSSGVLIGDERISAHTVLWAAGVEASALGRSLGVRVDRAGRVLVRPDLSVPDFPQLFVVGDLASLAGADGRPLPGVAQVAIQGGEQAARNIERLLAGQATEPFRYRDPGNLATIGRASAIADLGRVKLTGAIAWYFWLFVHIFFLIGFRNRISVILQWAVAYFTYQRSVRLITGDDQVQALEKRSA